MSFIRQFVDPAQHRARSQKGARARWASAEAVRWCKRCGKKWAQDGPHCRGCQLALGDDAPQRQIRGPVGGTRKDYQPPERPLRQYKDPLTGELHTFEVVFDGR